MRSSSNASDQSLFIVDSEAPDQGRVDQPSSSSFKSQLLLASSPPLQSGMNTPLRKFSPQHRNPKRPEWTDEADLYLLRMVVLRQTAPKLCGVNFGRIARHLITQGLVNDVTPTGVQNRLRTILFRTARPFNVHKDTQIELLEISRKSENPQHSSQSPQIEHVSTPTVLIDENKHKALDAIDAAAVRFDKHRPQTSRHWLRSASQTHITVAEAAYKPDIVQKPPTEQMASIPRLADADMGVAHSTILATSQSGNPASGTKCAKDNDRRVTVRHQRMPSETIKESLFFSSQSSRATMKADRTRVDSELTSDVLWFDDGRAQKIVENQDKIFKRIATFDGVGSLPTGSSMKPDALSRENVPAYQVLKPNQSTHDHDIRADRAARIERESVQLRARLQADLLRQAAKVQIIALSRKACLVSRVTNRTTPRTRVTELKSDTDFMSKAASQTKEVPAKTHNDERTPIPIQIRSRDSRYRAGKRRRKAEAQARRK